MVVLKTTATLGAPTDSQAQLDDHYTDDPFFTHVSFGKLVGIRLNRQYDKIHHK